MNIADLFGNLLSSLALKLGGVSTYYLCCLWFHQPKEPAALRERFAKK